MARNASIKWGVRRRAGYCTPRFCEPGLNNGLRRLMTVEIRIDGQTQGPVCEGLVRVT